MTRTTTATVAVAADYADAMLTARRAKNWLFLLLMLILLAQIAIFFLVKFKVLKLDDQIGLTRPVATVVTPPSTEPTAAAATEPTTTTTLATPVTKPISTANALRYVIPVLDFLGITLAIVLAIVLLLITLIMLVGRLIGVSHVTGAFIWCVLLVVFLFPWQSFLLSGPRDNSAASASISETEPAFKIPGVLYTWPELAQNYNFDSSNTPGGTMGVVLKWARFAGFPILALLMLLSVQAKSGRGLKFALGEADVQVEMASPTM